MAVIVNGSIPPAVVASVLTVIVVDPLPLTDTGENVALAPAGSPDTLNVTVPVYPLMAGAIRNYVAGCCHPQSQSGSA